MLSKDFHADLEFVQTTLGKRFAPETRRERHTGQQKSVEPPKKRLNPRLQAEAAKAVQAFKASSDGKALLENLGNLNLYEVQWRLGAALNGPHFASMLQMARGINLEIDPSDLVPKAVSIGLTGEAVLIFGVSGAAFYAMDISISDPKPAVVVGGAFDAGADGGLQVDIAVGFWADTTDDLDGVYVGEEIDIDDVGGVYEASFLKDEELALIVIGAGVGFEDGFENTDYYFYSFGISHSPIYQSGDSKYLLQFHTMECTNSKDDYDTVFFYFLQDNDDTQYRYPAWAGFQMCESGNGDYSNWGTGEIVKFDDKVTVKLNVGDYEMDDVSISIDDFNGVGSSYTMTFKEYTDFGINEIHYSLEATLIKAG